MVKSKGRKFKNKVGAWAFLIGVILALVIGLVTSLISIPALADLSTEIYVILALLGIIVGFMNVASKDSQTFLMAGTVLVIVSKFGMEGVTGSLIGLNIAGAVNTIFGALLVMFAPATVIVALKTVFGIAK